jgi:hypothetical protein
MTLATWLRTKDYDPDNALCITVGTDGLNMNRDKLMSISLARLGEEPQTFYIDGANCNKVRQYTGVDCSHYDEHKVGLERALELIAPAVANADFLVTYRCDEFTKPWLIANLPELFTQVEFMDLVDIIRIEDMGHTLPLNVDYVDDLRERLKGALVGTSFYSFAGVCARLLPDHRAQDTIVLEDKARLLQELYYRILLEG